MSFEWLNTTLGEICGAQGGAIQTGPFGSQLHTSDYKELGIPVVMPTNISEGGIDEGGIARIDSFDVERLSQHKLRIGDIVFSRRGDVTKSALVRPHEVGWLCGTGCLKVRLGDETIADAKFISYCLRLPETKEWLIRHAVGATMPNLNTGILSAVPINLPPLKAQLSIAATLGALDDRITLLRETNTTLEAIAQALFKSWFIDFDPVRAKAEGLEPGGMDAVTAALFPDSFEESELGLVPKSWKTVPFTETIVVIGGGTPKTSVADYWGGDIPWFSVVDAPKKSDVFVIDTEKHITAAGLNNSATKLLPAGTTIISARGTVGRLALVGRNMAMNQSCYGLCGRAGDSYFTYFNTYRLVESLKQRAHGSVFDTITRDTLAGVSIVYPSERIICEFETTLSPMMERIKENLKKAQTLTQLRDALLPRLISGKLRLPEVEAAIETMLSEAV
ncbi:restriction endonuclease subunit S [Pseudomonas sp. NMI760_13]|uniref:restriction endonuclease subunit S n=1 Tax=Pseudomonas sp. NMI760_13 TaxID=2903147 RepID=UPI001E38CCFC|nr:restriction endonuclease subunit S [Pseudomonas sp. NMI760_13]MCE0917331.1 restriction endonuclease subunit S [Pseudomonas sp. NMI760_13]